MINTDPNYRFLYLQEEEGNFTWIDGNKAEFLNFHHKQPENRKSEDCVFEWDGKWHDSTCNYKRHGKWHLVPLCQRTHKGNYSSVDLVMLLSYIELSNANYNFKSINNS